VAFFHKRYISIVHSLVLFFQQSYIKPLISSLLTNRILIVFVFILLFIPIYALSHLPFIDFRPYKIGVSIVKDKQLPADAKKDVYQDIWYYMVDGQIEEFATSDEPWKINGAVFKDRVTKLVSKGDEPKIHDFDLIDEFTGLNFTDTILNMKRVLLVVCYDIEKTSLKAHNQINQILHNTSIISSLPVYGLSSSSIQEIKNKLLVSELPYPYLLVDQTTLKTMIRANPGVFLLENGIVVKKWHWRDLPNELSAFMY